MLLIYTKLISQSKVLQPSLASRLSGDIRFFIGGKEAPIEIWFLSIRYLLIGGCVMFEICELDLPRYELQECPPCTEIFFRRIDRVLLARLPVVVVRRYVLRKCFVGLGVSHHVHSLTLLPQEQVEIEIVRRSKFSRALHEQRTVESEFRFEVQNTARDEWTAEEESNWKVGGGVDFSIFGIGVKSSGEYNSRQKTAEAHFREVISKTSTKVSRKYELAIDTKTEVENQYRSVRRISNPNPCQPVIYNYYQLAKRYKTELILQELRFDVLAPQRPSPPLLENLTNEVLFSAQPPYRQNLNLQIVAPPPAWTVSSASGTGEAPQFGGASFAQFAALQPFAARSASLDSLAQPVNAQIAFPAVNVAALPPVRVPVEREDFRQLTVDELIEKVGKSNPELVEQFKRELEEFLSNDTNQTGVRDSYEYCINTEGLYVETTVSKCAACDEATLTLRELEVETARVELELKRRQLEKGDDKKREPPGNT
jgi:hypothetical protein